MTGLASAPERRSPWEPLSASVPLTTGHPAQFPLKHVFLCISLLVQSYLACCHDNHQPYKRQDLAHLFRVGSCPEAEQGEPAILCIPLRKGWGFEYFVSREGYSLDCVLFFNSRSDGSWEGIYSVSGLCFYTLWCFNMSELELLGLNLQSEYFFFS